MGAVKDDLDSQHFWAGGKIKNMYGKTNMNFTGGLLQKRSTSMSAKEVPKEGATIQVDSLDHNDGERFSVLQLSKDPSKISEQGSILVPAASNTQLRRKRSIWKTLSQAMGSVASEEEEDMTPITSKAKKGSTSNANNLEEPYRRRRSSILFPMISGQRKQSQFKPSL